jgi:hypothetical protein
MSPGRIFGPLWAGNALDLSLNCPSLTGALILLAAGVRVCSISLAKH